MSEITLPLRGSFPNGPRGESVAQRRERYEQWVIDTQAPRPDFEGQSVQFIRERGKPSLALAIDSRCQQCVAAHDDANGAERIGGCQSAACGLHPVRPYQDKGGTLPGRREAVHEYCGQCMGGPDWRKHFRAVAEEVRQCPVVHCAIWPVRGRKKTGGEAIEAEMGTEGGAE